MRVLPYGPQAWLVEVPDSGVVGYAEAVRRARHPDVLEIVPAAATVLVRLRPGATSGEIGGWLATVAPEAEERDGASVPAVEIPTIYDGADLADVAARCGLTADDVVGRHVASRFVCAFCGFAPGFAYLTGLDPALVLPRRSTPRTRVPAGSVAIADIYSAIYPSASPGGWHLLGRTTATLWDQARAHPATITPGATVRFVPA